MADVGEGWIIIEKLTKIILDNVDGHVVEIGVGRSSRAINKGVKEVGVNHYMCDTSIKASIKWSQQKFKLDNVIIYEGKSLDFIKIFPDIPLSVVLLDGEHKYDTIKQELNFFLSRLVVGGVIFLHDTYPPDRWKNNEGRFCGDVYKIRSELEKKEDVQIFTWPYTAGECGLSMVMKKDPGKQFCYGEFYPW